MRFFNVDQWRETRAAGRSAFLRRMLRLGLFLSALNAAVFLWLLMPMKDLGVQGMNTLIAGTCVVVFVGQVLVFLGAGALAWHINERLYASRKSAV